jgi:SAM-dependent methyltransferase
LSQYVKFADVYDKMKADTHSIRMTETTFKIMRRFKIQAEEGLDLCCGTGTALKVFAESGMKMAGLDRSRRMLAAARKKLKGLGVELFCQSLPRFSIPARRRSAKTRQFDLVTSFFDSLNYLLTARDLAAAFRSVNRHLKRGGWFIFDMNTPAAMKALWDEKVQAEALKDLAWVWKAEYDPKRQAGDCLATFFVKKGRGWQRFDELHRERAYPNSAIKKMLRQAGFTVRGFYRCHTFEPPTRDTYRICAVAQKRK